MEALQLHQRLDGSDEFEYEFLDAVDNVCGNGLGLQGARNCWKGSVVLRWVALYHWFCSVQYNSV